MTGPALFLSGPEFEMFERRERFYKFDTTQHQTAERDIEYQDISQQENFPQQFSEK